MHPQGLGGALAGRLMARKNRERIAWAVRELAIRSGDRVLEIGYGPGVAVEEILSRVPDCEIYGLDPSTVMHAQAARRNRRAVESGKVTLRAIAAEDYAGQDAPFDLVFSINALPFCDDPPAVVQKASGWLRAGGRIAIVHQVPLRKAEAAAIDERESEISKWLADAGMEISRRTRLPARPNPVLFLEGVRKN